MENDNRNEEDLPDSTDDAPGAAPPDNNEVMPRGGRIIVIDDINNVDELALLDAREWFEPRINLPREDQIIYEPMVDPFVFQRRIRILETNCERPIDFFLILVTEPLLREIVIQTNLYARQLIERPEFPDFNNWTPTTISEIKKFFGIIIWMSVCNMPSISLYWSTSPLLRMSFPGSVMTLKRFELLLKVVHFSDSATRNAQHNRLRNVVNTLNRTFQIYCDAPENVRVDDVVIPDSRHLTFREYTEQAKHRQGFKIFKLRSTDGYTHRFHVCDDPHPYGAMYTPTKIVLRLARRVAGRGHTIYTNSWYTSLDLAEKLINRNTHLVGIVRPTRRGLDPQVVQREIQRGTLYGREHASGVTFLKWREKEEVYALSSKHSTETVTVTVNGRNRLQPAMIADYNRNRISDQVSDRCACYFTPLRETVEWYRRMAFELLLDTTVINAWVLHNIKNNALVSLPEFKMALVMELCQLRH